MIKKYGLYFLFILLLVIAVVIALNNRTGIFKGDENQFAVKDTGQVSLIEIRSPENTLVLEKMPGHWMINGYYTAGFKRISGLLTILYRLQEVAPVPRSIRFEIIDKLENEGIRLLVAAEQKKPHVLLMYFDTVYTEATYMMPEHSDVPYRIEIRGYPEKNLVKYFIDDVNYWRDNSIFHLREDQIMSVSLFDHSQADKSFHLVRQKEGGYKLFTYTDSIEITDIIETQVTQYLSYFSSVSFERFLSEGEIKDLDQMTGNVPDKVIKVVDTGDRVTLVKTYTWYVAGQDGSAQRDLNRLIAMINKTDMVIVKYIELDPVIKEIGYFLKGI